MDSAGQQRILVIKLSSLGDFVLSIASFQAIRAHHPDARIILLTTRPFVRLAEASGCFDAVWTDARPRLWQVARWLALARRLRAGRFDRVYDLQRSQRTGWYFRLAGRPEWVGKVTGCSHRYRFSAEPARHIAEHEAAQLALAGIAASGAPDLSFVRAEVARFALAGPYALLVPGCSPHRPGKRWPADRFAALAGALVRGGTTPVLLGTAAESAELAAIAAACPAARNLIGETTLEDIAVLARGARLAVGNDTGPMHLIAAAGCPSLVLFSGETDPVRNAPRGHVAVLQAGSLADLPVERVLAALPARAGPT